MGQIIYGEQKPKYCNLVAIQEGGSMADAMLDDGEVWLVDTTNATKVNKGAGDYDAYIKGDGVNKASQLPLTYLKTVADDEDLQSVDGVLKLADKAYDSAAFSGFGRVHLRKNISGGKNVLTQAMVNTANTIYHIQYDYDLNGETITLPTGCVLEFDGGSVKNGVIIGNHTHLSYNAPFLSNVTLSGSFFAHNDVRDTDIFSDSIFSTGRITSMLTIYGSKIIFAKNTYTNVESIPVTRNIDIDFGGSTLEMKLDANGAPSNLFIMPWMDRDSGYVLDYFNLSNVIIQGNINNTYEQRAGTGVYRRAVQLFNVKEVALHNIGLIHYMRGTSGDYTSDIIKRYELSAFTIFHYQSLVIDGFFMHDCWADSYLKFVPAADTLNMTEICNLRSYRNSGTAIEVIDGRVHIYNNSIFGNKASAMNVFCYDSNIHDNIVEGAGIDICEDGMYYPKNVNIYNNTALSSSICDVYGDNINIHDNVGPIIRITPGRNTVPSAFNALASDIVSAGTINIYNNTLNSQVSVIYSSSLLNAFGTTPFVSVLSLSNNIFDSPLEKTSVGMNPMNLAGVEHIVITDNTIKGGNRTALSLGVCAQIYITPSVNNLSKLLCKGNVFYIADDWRDLGFTQCNCVNIDTRYNNIESRFMDNFFSASTTADVFYVRLNGVQKDTTIYANIEEYTSNIIQGTTAQRPTLTSTDAGFQYYDKTLRKPIWWNGDEWTGGDKTYNASLFSGLGYVDIPKNIVSDGGTNKNVLTSSMVNAANTTYNIQYDFDLNGGSVTLGSGTTLEFNGGSIKNGTLIGTNTSLKGDYRFEGVTFSGTFTNENVEVTSNRFGTAPDISSVILAFPNAKINLGMDITTPLTVTGITHVDIEGNGYSVVLGMMNVASNTVNSTLKLQNVFFDCASAEYTGTGDKGLVRFTGILNGESSFYAQNCHFTGYKEASMIYVRRSASTIIEDCYIEGGTDFTNQYPAIQMYECSDVCTIQRNTIKNACSSGINIISGSLELSANIIDNVIIGSYTGAIIVSGGILYNSNICGNKIINSNRGGVTGAYGAAINCHGFQNLNLSNNYIDTPDSPGSYLDIDGNDGAGGRTRGIGLAIKGNYCKGNSFAIVNIDGGVVSDNSFISTHTSGANTLTGNLVFERNSLKDYSVGSGIISYNSSISSDMTIRNNYIELSSTNNTWFAAYSTASVGNVSIYGNKIHKYTDNAYVGWTPSQINPRNLVIDDHGTYAKETYQFNTKNGLRVLLPFSNNRQVYKVNILSNEDSAVNTTVDTIFKFVRLLNGTKTETDITTIAAKNIPITFMESVDIKYNINKIVNYLIQKHFLVCEPTEDDVDLIVEVYYKAEDNILYI